MVALWRGVLSVGVAAAVLGAQEHHDHGVGHVHLPTSCSAPAQQQFDRGVALLHSFWYEESSRTFAAVATLDSSCAMAYWGEAMSLLHPLWAPPAPNDLARGHDLSERAVARSRTPRERAYAEAIAAYYRDPASPSYRVRFAAYEQAMEQAYRSYPDDHEAAIFYALAILANGSPSDTTGARARRADSILFPLFRADPEHPGLAHYVIHANDNPRLAPLALDAARRYAQIAPDVPHALHMPSHIFTRLGLWDEAITANERSAAAARQFEVRQGWHGLWDQRGHAMDYLVYAYLQEGKVREAKQIVDEAAAVTVGYPAGSYVNAYALAAIPARYALERNAWSEAAVIPVRPAPDARETEAITRFARAIGAARSGDPAGAKREVDTLAAIERELEAVDVKIQRLAASAWIAFATGDTSTAIARATEAADLEDRQPVLPVSPGPVLPARELLGDLLLAAGRPREAHAAYAAMLTNAPHRTRSVQGYRATS
jgi:tetratricopeptide (TPR) repeat protein